MAAAIASSVSSCVSRLPIAITMSAPATSAFTAAWPAPVAVRDRVHVHAVGDDHALVAHLPAQQVGQDARDMVAGLCGSSAG
jgi:predicted S18 family serine protease